jgi:sugar/nucleoside kinase (ribokinase family)
MKILLIGHSIIDYFEEAETNAQKPGGLFYSALGIMSKATPDDKVALLTSWNEKSFELFREVYSSADLSMSNKITEMPSVILKTSHAGEREETYTNLSVRLSTEEVSNWNFFDAIMINMITGFDLSLEQLNQIRKHFTGTIYMDVHTLARGVNQNMKREFRQIPKVKEWMSNISVVQVNESELKTVCESTNEYLCAKNILSWGPEILIVTKGEQGAVLYKRDKEGLQRIEADAVKVNSVNKIGCGDIFGAVFFYSYISTKDVRFSLNNANRAGALAASIKNLTNCSRLDFNALQ